MDFSRKMKKPIKKRKNRRKKKSWKKELSPSQNFHLLKNYLKTYTLKKWSESQESTISQFQDLGPTWPLKWSIILACSKTHSMQLSLISRKSHSEKLTKKRSKGSGRNNKNNSNKRKKKLEKSSSQKRKNGKILLQHPF